MNSPDEEFMRLALVQAEAARLKFGSRLPGFGSRGFPNADKQPRRSANAIVERLDFALHLYFLQMSSAT